MHALQMTAWQSDPELREVPDPRLQSVHYEADKVVKVQGRLGFQSMIGLDSVIARLPQGVTLGQTEVGPASVLNGNTEARIGTAHLSTSARLG